MKMMNDLNENLSFETEQKVKHPENYCSTILFGNSTDESHEWPHVVYG